MQHKEKQYSKNSSVNEEIDGAKSEKPKLEMEEDGPKGGEGNAIKQEVELAIINKQKNLQLPILAQNQLDYHRQQSFSSTELKNLFNFYDQYGAQWSIFEQLMPNRYTNILQRNQNQLKNKLHSTLRTIIRLIIAASDKNPKEKSLLSSSRIPSNIIVDLYEGKKNFKRYRNLMKSMLQIIDYDIVQGKNQIEIFKENMGSQIFVNVYEELKQILTNKKLSNKGQGTDNKQLKLTKPREEVKKVNAQISEINPSQESNKKQSKVKQGSNNTSVQMGSRKHQKLGMRGQGDLREIIKNQEEIIHKLLLINELQRTQYMTLKFPQELVENLIKLERNFQFFLNQR